LAVLLQSSLNISSEPSIFGANTPSGTGIISSIKSAILLVLVITISSAISLSKYENDINIGYIRYFKRVIWLWFI